jgi:hypothetical protein
MVTKAGQLQLRDIKQGKQGWLVRVSRRRDRPVRATSIELVRFRRRPYLKKCDFPEFRSASPIIAFDPLHKPVLPGYHITMSAQVYGLCDPDKSYYRLPEDRRPVYLSRFFKTKEAALRYAHSINGYPQPKKKVVRPALPRHDIRDFDYLAVLGNTSSNWIAKPFWEGTPEQEKDAIIKAADELTNGRFSEVMNSEAGRQEFTNEIATLLLGLSNAASLDGSRAWLDAFKPKDLKEAGGGMDLSHIGRELPGLGPRGHVLDPLDLLDFRAPIRRNLLVCECGDTRQFPFYLGATCERCGTEFKQQNAETPPLEPLKWENLKKQFEEAGLPRATHLAAEMPLFPPVRLMDGMTNGVEPQRHLSILRGKHRQSPEKGEFRIYGVGEIGKSIIRSLGEVEYPMPPEHTGIKLAYKGVEPPKTEEEYKYGIELNLGMMSMPAVEEDPLYNAAYKAYRDYLKTQPKITYHIDTGGQPLNMYGSESAYKPFPDLNELPQDENGLVGLRKHENWGGKGVILTITDGDPKDLTDEMGNRVPDFIFEPAMPDQNILDYMTGKISLAEAEHRIAESKKRVAELLGETVEEKPFVDNNPTQEWDPNLDGMALMAATSGVINEDQYTLIRCRDDSTGFITAFQEYIKKGPNAFVPQATGPKDFLPNFSASHISGDWYVVYRDKYHRSNRIIDKAEYDRRISGEKPTEE